jgi:hypothetical protein
MAGCWELTEEQWEVAEPVLRLERVDRIIVADRGMTLARC